MRKIHVTTFSIMIFGVLTYVKSQDSLEALRQEDQIQPKQTRLPASSQPNNKVAETLSDQKVKNEPNDQLNQEAIHKLRNDIVKFHQCVEDGVCDFESTDSREEELTASKNLSNEIANFNAFVIQNQWKSPEITSLARELLKIDDGGIKEEALKLILSQDAETENVEAVIDGVLKYHDGNLVDAAIKELERHMNGNEVPMIHQGVKDCLLTGSFLVKENLSGRLGKIITSNSYPIYSELSENPSVDRIVRRNLKSNLSEFELNQSGG